jgi:hypothetical protein
LKNRVIAQIGKGRMRDDKKLKYSKSDMLKIRGQPSRGKKWEGG